MREFSGKEAVAVEKEREVVHPEGIRRAPLPVDQPIAARYDCLAERRIVRQRLQKEFVGVFCPVKALADQGELLQNVLRKSLWNGEPVVAKNIGKTGARHAVYAKRPLQAAE